MDAFGYKLEEDGNVWFSWLLVNTDGKTLWFTGILGEVQGQAIKLGDDFVEENFESKAIPMLQGLGYVFDFNEKCQELLIRFPLLNILDLHDFRFNRVEPLINDTLQRSGNGFCDYGYCDEEYLNLIAWVYSPEKAIQTFSTYLTKILKKNELSFSICTSQNGVPQNKLYTHYVE